MTDFATLRKLGCSLTGSLPKYYVDSVMSNGTLMLMDVGFSTNPWPSGVPSSGAVLPNIAWDVAAAIVGSGNSTTLSPTFNNLFTDQTKGKFERSSKGALHGMVSQLADAPSNQNQASLVFPTLIRDYLYANQGHAYYMSTWRKVTRAAKSGASSELILFGAVNTSSAVTSYLAYGDRVRTRPTSGNRTGEIVDPDYNVVSNQFRAIAVSGWTGTAPGANTNIQAVLSAWGAYGAFGSFGSQYSQSHADYRFYLEDLTVSGRDYATVETLDHARWAADFASGGRYYGDSMSDPSVAVP